MKIATSIKTLLASHLDHATKTKNATGLIHDWKKISSPEVIESFKSELNKVICFFAIDSSSDPELIEYISNGQLSSSSGKDILYLYLSKHEVPHPEVVDNNEVFEFVNIDSKINLTQEVVATYFKDYDYFKLPGILVFDFVPGSTDCIYIPIASSTNVKDKKADYHDQVTDINQVVLNAGKGTDFLSKVGKDLSLRSVDYYKSSKLSFSEYIAKIMRVAYDLKGDIISIVT